MEKVNGNPKEIHSVDEERESLPLINNSYIDVTPVTIANKQTLERDPRCRLNAVYPWEHRYTQSKQKQTKSRINTLQDEYALHIICRDDMSFCFSFETVLNSLIICVEATIKEYVGLAHRAL